MPPVLLSPMLFQALLLLSLLEGALPCRPGTPEECANLPFVPGYKLAGEGYDVVKLERKGAYVLDVYQTPEHSCRVCSNPLQGGQLQRLPLYMADWRSQSSCRRLVQSSTFTSISKVVESSASVIKNDWKVGLGLGDKLGLQMAGSKSKMHSFTSSSFRQDKSALSVHQLTCSHYRFRASSRFPLSHEFQQDLKSLPLEYTSNTTERYQRFIDTYGTHFIRLVELGGRLSRVTSIRTCLASLNKVTVSQVESCMSMGLSVGLGLGSLNATIGGCSKVFNSHDSATGYEKGYLSHMTEVTGGMDWIGDVSLTEEDSADFKRWLNSLKELPDILAFSASPLHDLVTNSKVRDNLQTAIRKYVIANGIEKNDTQLKPCGMTSPNLSPDCCPLLAGRGRLTVHVERAYSIRGDGWAEPEGYVKLWYGGQYRQTHWMTTYDPVWNSHFDFGNVETHPNLILEVWEKDVWHDDHLGGCQVNIQAGGGWHHCGLNHGSFSFSYQLTCDHHLSGGKCDQYFPSPR